MEKKQARAWIASTMNRAVVVVVVKVVLIAVIIVVNTALQAL